MKSSSVPSFFLYGEPPRAVDDRFLHLEDLDDRSRPSDWVIRPHAHANLNHLFYLAAGGGAMRADATSFAIRVPCLLVVPARTIHGFHYDRDTRGFVLTIADAYLRDLFTREPDLPPLFAEAAQIALAEDHHFDSDFARLGRELAWQAPAHRAAVEGRLLTILVDALRSIHQARAATEPRLGPQAILVARFRTLVEERFRENLSLEAYATTLAVSVSALRAACLKTARKGPSAMVQDRVMLEAKRLLLYSSMSVAEIGFSIGFGDPAYFSRCFANATSDSPRGFRKRYSPSAA